MILGLRLKNWRSHEASEFTFGKGTNLLIGSLGSGKSTALDAMCFALFGTFPALKNRRVTLEEVIMARPKQKAKAEVELKFACNNREYLVRREVAKGASEAWLYEGGKMVEGPQAQRVNEFVEKLLKIDYELFSRAIYSEQNRIDYLLNLPKGTRKVQVDQLLGISRFEEARKNAASALNKIKAARNEVASYVQGIDTEGLEKKTLQLKQELEALAGKKAVLLRELKEKEGVAMQLKNRIEALEKQAQRVHLLEAELEAAKATGASLKAQVEALHVTEITSAEEAEVILKNAFTELSFLEEAQKKFNDLRVQENALVRELALAEEELKSLAGVRSVEECSENIAGLQRSIESNNAELKKKQQKILTLSSKAAGLSAEISRAEKAGEEAKAVEARLHAILEHGDPVEKVAAAESEFRAFNSELASLKAKEKELNAALKALSENKACPVCDSELREEKRNALKAKRGEELEVTRKKASEAEEKVLKSLELRKKISDAAEEVKALRSKALELEAIVCSAGKLAEEKAVVMTEVAALNKETEELEGKANALNEKLVSLNKEFQQAQRARALQAQCRKAGEKISAVSSEKFRLAAKFSEELLSEARKRVKEAENALQAARLKEKIDAAKEREAKTTAEIAGIAFDEKALDKARDEFVALSSEVARLNSDLEHSAAFEKEKSLLFKDVEEKLSKAREALGKIASLDEASKRLSLFEEALVATQSALRSQLIDCVNEALLRLWPAIYPYRDYVAARVEAGEEDYSLQLQTNFLEWTPVEAVSGGERSCAALALRIAFATVLAPNLSWLVLDEPTHNLDRNAVLLLARALREEIPKIVEQTFIITHDEDLKEAASAKVWHVERDKERGDATNVEETSVDAGEAAAGDAGK